MSLAVYWWYMRAMTIPLCLVFLMFYVFNEGVAVYAAIWLSNMAGDAKMIAHLIQAYYYQIALNSLNLSLASIPPMTQATISEQIKMVQNNQTVELNDAANIRRYYLWWYLGFGVIQAVFVLAYSVLFAFMVANASRYVHMSMIGEIWEKVQYVQ